MQISKQNLLPFLANFSISFFFLSVLAFKGGHNVAPFFLITLGIGYGIYGLIKKFKWNLSQEDKWLIYSYIFYFSVFVLSLFINEGRGRELDNPSRAILLIPALIFLLRMSLKLCSVVYAIPLGSLIAGLVALYDKFILHSAMAYSPRTMQIQGGDIAMSLGLFSIVVGLYYWQKSQKKISALCIFASFFGIVGSILSTARGGWIVLPIVLIVILLIYSRSLSKGFFLSLIGVFAVVAVGVTQMPNSPVMARLSLIQSDIAGYEKNNANTSLGLRFEMWKSAIQMIKEKPILGWGEQGATDKRKQDVKTKAVIGNIGRFTHAHNQYLDDLSKRGIVGFIAFLGILLVPFYQFKRRLNSTSSETKLIAALGVVHILSVMIYCLSQGFFAHNSGNIFYLFLTTVFYAMLKQSEKRQSLERV
ncbi:O-antigen ligase family protein [Rodentibacter pneumotropicus]|uniref:RfaL protein n=1 Tax=Rodentibacter pneumotropicus TaxID=758 RepID=A0A448MKQ3_9PAST|nr:O-antigen ligase [Rodentibacter pneumotropicus]NBH75397.1 O-antigen ligase family protein [Rodentibacter pneumotropicus]OOF65324.1 RfaL protein [Rodentibacter pneumotropicus]THA03004.1 O-antigen ligase family protein [Rodentibacter pneumotropicus]THA06167.1 O-antigen ligase family protein [Rodentibacter pneumotropicus]THA13838.1 O-antigen ligase family protein [Rodentibacter pneumotropicus]